eukprot:753713-Hanusia_phi.AAC.5
MERTDSVQLQPGMLSDVYESYDDPIDERLDDYARSSTYMVDQESELGLDDLVNDDNGLVLLENSVVGELEASKSFGMTRRCRAVEPPQLRR